MKSPKYLIYTRKSTDTEDKQVLSIASQIKELKSFAEKRNLEILEVISEKKSAKAPGRPRFNKMMERIYKENVDGILCWKLDRLARNPIDGGTILWAVKDKRLTIKTPVQTYKQENNTNLLMYVEFGMAQKYIDDLGKNVKRGLRAKCEMGWYPFVAPQGYLNTPDREKGYKIIIKDPERFRLVRKMWDLMLTGNYTVPEILNKANNDWGYKTLKRKRSGGTPLSKSALYNLFSNTFYYGTFQMNNQWYEGKHPPMITKAEFDKVQKLLGRKNAKRPQKHKFAFTGMILCGECGYSITATHKEKYFPKTGNSSEYNYYHCTKKSKEIRCNQKPINKKDLEKQIKTLLSQIEIPKEFKEWAIKYLREWHKRETAQKSEVIKSLQKEYNNIDDLLDTLLDKNLHGLYTDEEYSVKKEKLQHRKNEIKKNLENMDTYADKLRKKEEETFKFAKTARKSFENGNLKKKREILQRVGSKFILKDGKLLISLKKPFLKIKEGKNIKPEEIEWLETVDFTDISSDLVSAAQTNPTWLERWYDFRRIDWGSELQYPEWTLKEVNRFLHLNH